MARLRTACLGNRPRPDCRQRSARRAQGSGFRHQTLRRRRPGQPRGQTSSRSARSARCAYAVQVVALIESQTMTEPAPSVFFDLDPLAVEARSSSDAARFHLSLLWRSPSSARNAAAAPLLPDTQQLAAACPDGVDVYFENVGGAVWDAVFPLLTPFARIPVCGLIAHYNSTGPFEGPDRLPTVMRQVLAKSLTIRGFIQREFVDQRPVFYREMAGWIESGQVKYREDVVDGLENAPQALIGLLEGRNFGKLLIKVS